MKFFQKLGKSLMLPVCVLPICGILTTPYRKGWELPVLNA